jgi:ADP-heptose:LPS heptosyltransferase
MMYTAESNLELGRMLGMDPAGVEYSFPAADGAAAAAEAEAFVSSLGDTGGGLAGVVPAATYPSKGWPAERFAELAGRISAELGMTPVIMWGPGEKALAAEIASAVPGAAVPPATDIAGAGALIKRMKVLVGIDSGPKHLAVLLGVPTVTLFGPTDPRIWDPMDEKHRAVWKDLECAIGCRDKDCRPNRCMEMITVDEVFEEVSDLAGGGA